MLQLPPTVFSILTGLIEDRCGLHYTSGDRELIASRISPRAVELGFDSLLDYYYFLRYDPKGGEELDQLLETLAIHETYFFREAEQLKVLVDTVLVPKVLAGARPRVWCAAASSGEEVYTLAMLLAEKGLLDRVELIASDLSHKVLAHAQHGKYSGRALRSVAGTVASRYLEDDGETATVSPRLRESIRWLRINLVEASQVEALGQFDVILCRNVLIYFGDQTTARVVRQLSEALKVGGLLLVGAAESLIHIGTSLGFEERSGSFFYRRSC